MGARRKNEESDMPRRPPSMTPDGRERQLIAKAVDLAEKQMDEGTASSQVITHYLKLGSSREFLEQERIAMDIEMLEAKKEQMASQKRVEELYEQALGAMRSYAGQDPTSNFDD